jgi:hypothetical protein
MAAAVACSLAACTVCHLWHCPCHGCPRDSLVPLLASTREDGR